MEPSSRSLYTTLLSNTSKSEFRENTPASFKMRLPYPLRVNRDFKIRDATAVRRDRK